MSKVTGSSVRGDAHVWCVAVLQMCLLVACGSGQGQPEPPPEGYYAFVESPSAEPPHVRRPPYLQSDKECPGVRSGQRSLNNLCGDLNKGFIPRNPMDQHILGSSYPFELIKNKTLQFFSRTLPILKADDTLPKVAKYHQLEQQSEPLSENHLSADYPHLQPHKHRSKREDVPTDGDQAKEEGEKTTDREARKFCDNGGVLCMLYKALNGEPLSPAGAAVAERRDDVGGGEGGGADARRPQHEQSPPPTPCPAKVDYATPVFAKNYQGVWRYVVQIPYEGYFTQTVEVTRCLQSRCYYMEGGCMSSPRWTSMLVAEIFYPDTFLPSSGARWPARRTPVQAEGPPPVHDFQNYQQYLHKRAGAASPEEAASTTSTPPPPPTSAPSHCDGVDELGCFQVTLPPSSSINIVLSLRSRLVST
ncbi:hypothetical protein PR048_014358 [Dryococelus australis]|uniref:Spaetzle domain-containing protein n=1 Tax=Dryococelus australis TaxID=614101 RepID=A0ABQ9HE84_9NEOP|nr:hypothetical protein PR048_014358 [Dryococelus australis]